MNKVFCSVLQYLVQFSAKCKARKRVFVSILEIAIYMYTTGRNILYSRCKSQEIKSEKSGTKFGIKLVRDVNLIS